MRGIALSAFGWAPSEFWSATPHAFLDAVDAHRMANDPEYRRRQEFADFRDKVERGLNDRA